MQTIGTFVAVLAALLARDALRQKLGTLRATDPNWAYKAGRRLGVR